MFRRPLQRLAHGTRVRLQLRWPGFTIRRRLTRVETARGFRAVNSNTDKQTLETSHGPK
jgi:hypothetical protein